MQDHAASTAKIAQLEQALAAKEAELKQASATVMAKVCLVYIGSDLLRLD